MGPLYHKATGELGHKHAGAKLELFDSVTLTAHKQTSLIRKRPPVQIKHCVVGNTLKFVQEMERDGGSVIVGELEAALRQDPPGCDRLLESTALAPSVRPGWAVDEVRVA